jgi:hypothetical protein
MPWIVELTVAELKFIFANADGFDGKVFVQRVCSATWDLKVRRSANTLRRREYFITSYLRTLSYNTYRTQLLQSKADINMNTINGWRRPTTKSCQAVSQISVKQHETVDAEVC